MGIKTAHDHVDRGVALCPFQFVFVFVSVFASVFVYVIVSVFLSVSVLVFVSLLVSGDLLEQLPEGPVLQEDH